MSFFPERYLDTTIRSSRMSQVQMACILKPDLQTSNSCHSSSLHRLQFCKIVLSTGTAVTCFTEHSTQATLNRTRIIKQSTPSQEEKQRPPEIAQNLIEWINAILTQNKNRNRIVAFKKKVALLILGVSQDNFHRSCGYSTDISSQP